MPSLCGFLNCSSKNSFSCDGPVVLSKPVDMANTRSAPPAFSMSDVQVASSMISVAPAFGGVTTLLRASM